jgi:signal transduction histidine kinase/DNA-binding response OmpR family regulator
MFVSLPYGEPQPIIAYVAPVARAGGEPVGLAILYARASAFWRVIASANERAGRGSFAVVLDSEGVRIAHGLRQEHVFHPTGRLAPEVVAGMVRDRRFGERTGELLAAVIDSPEQLASARDPALTSRATRLYSTANDTWNLTVARRLRVTPWTVVTMVPEASVLAPARHLTSNMLLASAAIGLLGFALGLVLSRRILMPIVTLTEVTNRVAAGDLTAQVKLERNDEIGQLGARFNEMTRSIKAGQDRLEARVQERTESLAQANHELASQKEELLVQQVELSAQQHELRGKNDEVERANRLKSEFLANMSHELRTPLNSIIGFSELLRDDLRAQVEPRHLGYIEDVLDSGRHLLSLINDILDLSKIEAGRLTLTFESVVPAEAIGEACDLMRPAARKKRIEIVSEVSGRRPLRADPAKLRQVLLNLLSNAVKFSPDGSRILVTAEDGVGVVRLAVRDQGPGIEPELIGRLFQPFVQGENPLVKKHQGTGLGLAICKRLVEQHGGTIEVESERGAGTLFRVIIPAASSGVVARTPEDGRLHVLIADEPTANGSLRASLEGGGYAVEELGARDVVDVAQEVRPVAIVIDPARPSSDGGLAVDRLQRNDATRDIPLVASTAAAAGFVAKPIATAALLERVRALTSPEGGADVLVIDDDPTAGALLQAVLTPAGYRVKVVHTGTEGVEAARSAPPHLTIVDLKLPDISGFDVIEALASDPRTRDQPMLVLTAADLEEEERARLRQRVRAVADKGNILRVELLAAVGRATGRTREASPVRGPTILVVDDHDLNRELARAILERKGYAVAVAEDGEAAVRMAREHVPALILMDLAMPRKDGYTAARELKAEPSTAAVPIVALSALAMRGDEAKALAAGIDAYLTKPIDREALEATVDRFLGEGVRS